MATADEVERGKYIEFKGQIYQVIRKDVISVGKHSHSKLYFTIAGLDGTGEKEIILTHNDKVDILDIMKKDATILSLSETGIQIMDSETFESYDAVCPDDLRDKLIEGESIIYVVYNNSATIVNRKSQK